jgi:hypothetical protein
MKEMTDKSRLPRKRIDQLSQGLDLLLYAFSTYALPIVIGLLSLLALFTWKSQYAVTAPQQLRIQVVQESANMIEPAQALAQLQNSPFSSFHDTRLSESPVWLSFVVPKNVGNTPLMVEFPSRHAMDVTCWDARTVSPLGSCSRHGTAGSISAV